VPTIRALRSQAESLRHAELERALRLLARGDDPRQVIEALSHGLTNKLMHGPTRYLNQTSGEQLAEANRLVQRLYNLHPDE
jgi:glutamyl-tRNA reductase